MAHALLSPSSGSRWLACPPSARLERGFPNTSSDASEEGTLAHLISELMAANEDGELTPEQLAEVSQQKHFHTDMIEHGRDFNNYVLESMPKRHTLLIEHRVYFDQYVREGFGTIDRLGLHGTTLQVFDYKYGLRHLVIADNNTQLKIYGVGGFIEFCIAYDIKTVILHIYQPRLHSVTKWETTVEELLDWAENDLKPAADLAFEGKGDFAPGPHCTFCKAKAVCRALAEENMALAKEEFSNPDLLDESEFLEIFAATDRIRGWIDAVEKHALKQALQGKNWKGYKVVEGTVKRVFSNEKELMFNLQLAGFEEITKPPALLPRDTLKKVLGPSVYKRLVEPELYKPTGRPTLALLTDKRPVFSSAATDFDDDYIDEE